MAKQPSEPERSDDYEAFEQTVKRILTVPKPDLDAAVEREKETRRKAHPSSKKR